MIRESKKSESSNRSSSLSGSSSSSDGKRLSTEPNVLEEYTLAAAKRPSKSLVHFADMVRNGSEYEPERYAPTSPPPCSAPAEDEVKIVQDNQGLNIAFGTDGSRLSAQRPSFSGQALHQSFERRRSSYRASSMDLTEALALGPGGFHRRCSVQR